MHSTTSATRSLALSLSLAGLAGLGSAGVVGAGGALSVAAGAALGFGLLGIAISFFG